MKISDDGAAWCRPLFSLHFQAAVSSQDLEPAYHMLTSKESSLCPLSNDVLSMYVYMTVGRVTFRRIKNVRNSDQPRAPL